MLQLGFEYDEVGIVIVYDQYAFTFQVFHAVLFCAVVHYALTNFRRDGKREGRALSGCTFGGYIATHQSYQPLADGQSEAGAPVPAGSGGVYLREGPEKVAQLFLRNTYTGIAHCKADLQGVVFGSAFLIYVDEYFAIGSELEGIAGQVDEHLFQAEAIANNPFRQSWIDLIDKVYVILGCLLRKEVHHIFQDQAKFIILFLYVHASGFDLGEIEDVIDDTNQAVATGYDRVGILALLVSKFSFTEQGGHAYDAVHRRSDLMAHGSQEYAFGLICFLGLFSNGLFMLFLDQQFFCLYDEFL